MLATSKDPITYLGLRISARYLIIMFIIVRPFPPFRIYTSLVLFPGPIGDTQEKEAKRLKHTEDSTRVRKSGSGAGGAEKDDGIIKTLFIDYFYLSHEIRMIKFFFFCTQ